MGNMQASFHYLFHRKLFDDDTISVAFLSLLLLVAMRLRC